MNQTALTIALMISLATSTAVTIISVMKRPKHITFHMGDSSDLSFMQLDEAKGTVTVYEKDGDVNQVFTCVGGFKK